MKLKEKTDEIEFIIKSGFPPNQGIFFDGQIFDAYTFVSDLVKSASKTIVLIDNYIDESVTVTAEQQSRRVRGRYY
jgi:hypothetical protein